MTPVFDTVRRLLLGVPNTHAERVQTVRDEIVEHAEEEQWSWGGLERSAKAAHRDLDNGNLPEPKDEIGQYIRSVCERYQKRGYSLEDLRVAVDGVKAKASAQQST